MQSSYNSNLEAQKNHNLFIRTGSFWKTHTKDWRQFQLLMETTLRVKLFNQFSNAANNLLKTGDATLMDKVCTFKLEDINLETSRLYDKFPFVYDLPENDVDKMKYDDEASYYYYSLPLPPDVTPLSIWSSVKGRLVINNDFYVVYDRIWFTEKPSQLFPEYFYLIKYALTTQKSFYAFPLRVQGTDDTLNHVVRYEKVYQTPHQFKLAIASVGGLKILASSQKLKSKRVSTNGQVVTYVFDNEVLEVDYPHEHLTVDTYYDKDTIIGDGVKVFAEDASNKGTRWWSAAPWKGGFSLGAIAGVPGVVVPDDECFAYIANAETVDGYLKLHVRLDLPGEFTQVQHFWENVEKKEKASNIYLNDIVGLTSLDIEKAIRDHAVLLSNYNRRKADKQKPDFGVLTDLKVVVPIDVFFEAILALKGLLIFLNTKQLKNVENVLQFIKRELPFGSCPLIMIDIGDVEDVYDVDSKIIDSYSKSIRYTYNFEDTVSLANTSDIYTINHED